MVDKKKKRTKRLPKKKRQPNVTSANVSISLIQPQIGLSSLFPSALKKMPDFYDNLNPKPKPDLATKETQANITPQYVIKRNDFGFRPISESISPMPSTPQPDRKQFEESLRRVYHQLESSPTPSIVSTQPPSRVSTPPPSIVSPIPTVDTGTNTRTRGRPKIPIFSGITKGGTKIYR